MLIKDELEVIHPKDEYAIYIKDISKDDKSLLKLSHDFDDWLTSHKYQLTDYYQEARADGKQLPSFLTWARERYYFWRYNQEKKKLKGEIDDLTSMP